MNIIISLKKWQRQSWIKQYYEKNPYLTIKASIHKKEATNINYIK